MPNRIIKESICTSETIDALSWFEEVFFYRLIVNCDDYGRIDARPAILKSNLFPLNDGVTKSQIEKAVNALATAGLVDLYEVDGKPYLQLSKWSKHQRLRNSREKYPAPDESCLRQSAASCGECSQDAARAGAESESQSESESNTYMFDTFWNAYPKKSAKVVALKSWQKLNPDDILLKTILDALEVQKRSDQWQRDSGKYVPLPATWINQKRWEDEITQPQPQAPSPAPSYKPQRGHFETITDEYGREEKVWKVDKEI